MAWAFLIIGALMLVAAWKKKQGELWELLKDDFSGDGNFFVWMLAIIFLVVLGNIKAIKPVTDAFLLLVIVVIVLGSKNLFGSFMAEIEKGTTNG